MAEGPSPLLTDERRISDHVWDTHKKEIRFKINVSVFQHLVDEEIILVTDDAADRYSNAPSESDKKDIIVTFVPKCAHDDYMHRFIRCLRKSIDEAGKAHKELAHLLEIEYEKVKENGVPKPANNIIIEDQMPRQETTVVRGGTPVVPIPSFNKCMAKVRANRKLIMVYATSLIWLLLGSLVSIIISQILAVRPSRPLGIVGQVDSIIEIYLGIDPFWLSSATIAITPTGCTGRLYVLTNTDCSTLPITVQEFDRTTLLAPPFSLLKDSTFNITLGEKAQTVWFIGSRVGDCDNVDKWLCEDPPLPVELQNFRTVCHNGLPGDTFLYTAESSDYYVFCAKGGLFAPGNILTLKRKGINATVFREQYRPNIDITLEPQTIEFKQSFDFIRDTYCLFLDVDRSHCIAPDQAPYYTMEITTHQRQDIIGLVILISILIFFVHLIIVGSSHLICQKSHSCARLCDKVVKHSSVQ